MGMGNMGEEQSYLRGTQCSQSEKALVFNLILPKRPHRLRMSPAAREGGTAPERLQDGQGPGHRNCGPHSPGWQRLCTRYISGHRL